MLSHSFAADVESAFLGIGMLPPPSTSTDVFSRFDRSGARGAAEAGIPFLVQCVEGHCVAPDIRPDIPAGPIRQGVELMKPVVMVKTGHREFLAGRRLLTAQAG